MPKLIACVAGLVALIAGIFGDVEPSLCLQRAFVSLILGWCVGAVLQALSQSPVKIQVGYAPADSHSTDEDEAKAA
ncbi:MAG TPA: hypothetical protein VK171_09215 [Fimbriimonas sp.]|nr:hypothetical protein [Fimbriimonas sp.]